MKRILVLVAAAAGFIAWKRMQDNQAERELWAEATDDIRSTPGQ